jgi:hypothetical protein
MLAEIGAAVRGQTSAERGLKFWVLVNRETAARWGGDVKCLPIQDPDIIVAK